MMMCAQPIIDQETAYLAALQTAATYKIQDTKLELRNADGALAASFSQQPVTPLAGPTWVMIGYNNGKQAVVSASADTEVTAIFGEDGQLSGSAGCNTYNAPYTVDGDKIKIGPAITTRMMCEQPIMDQETLYLAAIQTAATYKAAGSKLELRDATGALVADYAQQAASEPQPTTAPAPAATPAPVAAPTAKDPQGTYLTLRPAADGGFTTMALQLKPEGAAELTSSYTDEAPIVQTGTWQDNGDDTLTVTLTDVDGKELAKPTVVKFNREGAFLNAAEYDKAIFGAEGLKLNLAADVARKVGPALMTLDLAAGFPLDPTFMSLNGGGEVDASLLGPDCKGFINRNPVVTVNWTGEAEMLRAFFYSDSDSTLVVLTPDGKLVCNDNANEQLLDPVLEIEGPGRRQVPHLGGQRGQPAAHPRHPGPDRQAGRRPRHLRSGQAGPPANDPGDAGEAGAAGRSRRRAERHRGRAQHRAGAQARRAADRRCDGGRGHAALPVPADQDLRRSGGRPSRALCSRSPARPNSARRTLKVTPTPRLLVVGNDLKTVECNDDATPGANLNPLVTLTNPADDTYAVYVGRLDPTKPVKGKLIITDVADAVPAVLAPVKK